MGQVVGLFKPSRSLRAAVSMCLVVIVLSAQNRNPVDEQPAGSTPLFKTSTELVQITVVVRGPGGKPVANLGKRDFVVKENGRVQRLSTVTLSQPMERATAAGTMPRGVFSNNGTPGKKQGLSVLLVDQLNTDPGNWAASWPQVVRFVRDLNRNDRLAIYVLDAAHGLRVVHRHGEDTADLLGRLSDVGNSSPQIPDVGHLLQFGSRGESADQPQFLSIGRVVKLADALTLIARQLEGSEGRKALIWLASSFPNPFQHARNSGGEIDSVVEQYRSRMLAAVNRLIVSDVAIYPVDARGLAPDTRFDASNQDVGIRPIQVGEIQNTLRLHDFSALHELARHSGGRAYYNTNGIAQAIAEVALAEQTSYTLEFYTTEPRDDKYHSLKISVHESNVNLAYRPGYWALGKPDNLDATRRDLKLELDNPVNSDRIKIRVRVLEYAAQSRSVTLDVRVNSSDFRYERNGDSWTGQLDLIFGQKDELERVFAIPPYRINLRLTDRDYSQAGGQWLATKINLSLRQQIRTIRIVARDGMSGRIGSIDIPVNALSKTLP